MIHELAIITSAATREKDDSLERLAAQMGIRVRRISRDPAHPGASRRDGSDGTAVAGAISSKTLGRLIEEAAAGGEGGSPLFAGLEHLFVYDFEPDPLSDLALRSVAASPEAAVKDFPCGGARFEVHTEPVELVGELGGRAIGGVDPLSDFCFDGLHRERTGSPIIAADGRPFMVRTRWNGLRVYLVAATAVADPLEQVGPDFRFGDRFSGLLPFVMFLKHVFGDRCWHVDHRWASFIIDDPLLKDRYGFLDYERLTRLMTRKGFTTSIAFIPWNFRRTKPKAARYFKERRDLWSLCVHGCDHTAGEFASRDRGRLGSLVRTATERMIRHERDTGLGFDRIMVFPQGLFSTAALEALQANDYLAAANSSIHADDGDEVRISDYLDLALAGRGGVPVFLRRYPHEVEDVMIGLFLGKPALLVEHQGYFGNGDDDHLTAFADEIRACCPGIRWAALAQIALRSYQSKRIDEDTLAVRLYCPETLFENPGHREQAVLFTKREKDPAAVRGVRSDGLPVEYEWNDGTLSFTREIGPGETAGIRILYEPAGGPDAMPQTRRYRLRVLGRRALSEFRDEFLSRHARLLAAVEWARSVGARKEHPNGRPKNER